MILVKTYETTDMPEDVFNALAEVSFVKDGVSDHVVGYYDSEALKLADAWLIANGASMRERVFIYHGPLLLNTDHLFPKG